MLKVMIQSYPYILAFIASVHTANVTTTKTRVSAKFKRCDKKPPENDIFTVMKEKSDLSVCLKECTFYDTCLTAVYDYSLRECSLYSTNSQTEVMTDGQSGVTRDGRISTKDHRK